MCAKADTNHAGACPVILTGFPSDDKCFTASTALTKFSESHTKEFTILPFGNVCSFGSIPIFAPNSAMSIVFSMISFASLFSLVPILVTISFIFLPLSYFLIGKKIYYLILFLILLFIVKSRNTDNLSFNVSEYDRLL